MYRPTLLNDMQIWWDCIKICQLKSRYCGEEIGFKQKYLELNANIAHILVFLFTLYVHIATGLVPDNSLEINPMRIQ